MPARCRTRWALPTATLMLLALSVTATATPAPSLYERMGGHAVVTAVVNDTIDRVATDPRTKRSFDGSNLRRIKQKLTELLCQLSGGGCTYTGDSMRDSHAEHQITQAEFYGLVEILRDALRRHHVGLRERNELLAILAPMQRDVVNVRAPKPVPAPTP